MSFVEFLKRVALSLPTIVNECQLSDEIGPGGKRRKPRQHSNTLLRLTHTFVNSNGKDHKCTGDLTCFKKAIIQNINENNVKDAVPLIDLIGAKVQYDSSAISWLSKLKKAIELHVGDERFEKMAFYLHQLRVPPKVKSELEARAETKRQSRYADNIVLQASEVDRVMVQLTSKIQDGKAGLYDKLVFVGLACGGRLVELVKSAFDVVCDKKWIVQILTVKKRGKNGRDPVLYARAMHPPYVITEKDLDIFNYGRPENLKVLRYVKPDLLPTDLTEEKACSMEEMQLKPFVYCLEPISRPPLGSPEKRTVLLSRERFIPLVGTDSEFFVAVLQSIRDELRRNHDLLNMTRDETEQIVSGAANQARLWFPTQQPHAFTFHTLRAIWVTYITQFYAKYNITVEDLARLLLDHNERDFGTSVLYRTVKLLTDEKTIREHAEYQKDQKIASSVIASRQKAIQDKLFKPDTVPVAHVAQPQQPQQTEKKTKLPLTADPEKLAFLQAVDEAHDSVHKQDKEVMDDNQNSMKESKKGIYDISNIVKDVQKRQLDLIDGNKLETDDDEDDDEQEQYELDSPWLSLFKNRLQLHNKTAVQPLDGNMPLSDLRHYFDRIPSLVRISEKSAKNCRVRAFLNALYESTVIVKEGVKVPEQVKKHLSLLEKWYDMSAKSEEDDADENYSISANEMDDEEYNDEGDLQQKKTKK